MNSIRLTVHSRRNTEMGLLRETLNTFLSTARFLLKLKYSPRQPRLLVEWHEYSTWRLISNQEWDQTSPAEIEIREEYKLKKSLAGCAR